MSDLRKAAEMAFNAAEPAMKSAIETIKKLQAENKALRQALSNEFNPDWNQVEALQESLREHMAEIQRLRQALAQPEHTAWVTAGEHTVPLKTYPPNQEVRMFFQQAAVQRTSEQGAINDCLRKAAEAVLEALEKVKKDADTQPPVYPWDSWRLWVDEAINRLRQALAQPKQEPAEYKEECWACGCEECICATKVPGYYESKIKEAVLAEREACAEICDGISGWYETRTDLNQTQKQVGQLAAELCGVRIRGNHD